MGMAEIVRVIRLKWENLWNYDLNVKNVYVGTHVKLREADENKIITKRTRIEIDLSRSTELCFQYIIIPIQQ